MTEAAEAASFARFELRTQRSLKGSDAALPPFRTPDKAGATVFRRKTAPKGPMSGFGYSWLEDQLEKTGTKRPSLLDRPGPRDAASFAYEALNLVDGRRSVRDIRDFLSATIAPVPIEPVAEYLETLEKIGLLED